jgi:hypothetical protein
LAALKRLARVVNIPTLMDDCEVLLAVVASPAAHGRGAGAKVTATGSNAVARRVLGQWAGSGLPLPQAKAPSTIARLVILFGSDSYCHPAGFSEHDLSRMMHICGLDEGLD